MMLSPSKSNASKIADSSIADSAFFTPRAPSAPAAAAAAASAQSASQKPRGTTPSLNCAARTIPCSGLPQWPQRSLGDDGENGEEAGEDDEEEDEEEHDDEDEENEDDGDGDGDEPATSTDATRRLGRGGGGGAVGGRAASLFFCQASPLLL